MKYQYTCCKDIIYLLYPCTKLERSLIDHWLTDIKIMRRFLMSDSSIFLWNERPWKLIFVILFKDGNYYNGTVFLNYTSWSNKIWAVRRILVLTNNRLWSVKFPTVLIISFSLPLTVLLSNYANLRERISFPSYFSLLSLLFFF